MLGWSVQDCTTMGSTSKDPIHRLSALECSVLNRLQVFPEVHEKQAGAVEDVAILAGNSRQFQRSDELPHRRAGHIAGSGAHAPGIMVSGTRFASLIAARSTVAASISAGTVEVV